MPILTLQQQHRIMALLFSVGLLLLQPVLLVFALPPAKPKPAKAVVSVQSLLEQEIKPLRLPSLEEATPLTLDALFTVVLKQSPVLSLNQEKINESNIRFKKVASKRLLFFFKYLNASYLENSALKDVQANQAQYLQAQNQVLLQAGESYYQLAKAYLARYIYFQTIQQGLLQLQVNQAQFQIGESTSFDGLETESELITRYQQYLASNEQVLLANQAITRWMMPATTTTTATGVEPIASTALNSKPTLWKPADFTNPQTNTALFDKTLLAKAVRLETVPELKLLTWVKPTWNEATVLNLAHENRADVQEAEHRIESSRSLIKAAAFDFNKQQGELLVSTLKQLELKTQVLRQQLEWEVSQAYRAFELAKTQLKLVATQVHLAKQFASQRQLSAKAGFASNKDVLQAQLQLAQAHVKQLDATVEYNLKVLQLLYSMGLLTHTQSL